MTIRTRTLKYSLYVEGIKIPVQTIHFNNICGQGCTMTASIPPHPSCYVFKRGMYVQLFKSVNDGPGVLRFSGIVVNKVYGKSGNSRDLRLECASPDVRMSSMKISETDASNLSMLSDIDIQGLHKAFSIASTNNISYGSEVELIEALAGDGNASEIAKMQVEHFDNGGRPNSGRNEILSLADKRRSGKLTGDDLLKNVDSIKNVDKRFKMFTSSNIENEYTIAHTGMNNAARSYAEAKYNRDSIQGNILNLEAMSKGAEGARKKELTEEIAKNKEKLKDANSNMETYSSSFKEYAAFVGKDTKQDNFSKMSVDDYIDYRYAGNYQQGLEGARGGYNRWGDNVDYGTMGSMAVGEGAEVTDAKVRSNMMTDRYYQVSNINTPSDNGQLDSGNNGETFQQVNRPSFARRFTKYAEDNGGDYFKAFVDLILYFYSLVEDHRIRYEADYFDIISMDGKNGNCFYSLGIVDGSSFKESEMGKLTNAQTGVGYTPIAKVLADIINQTVHSSEAGTPVINVVQQVLSTMMAKFSVVHTQFNKSIVIHPLMCNYFPPCRNVIFPGMASSIQYNPNDWANPTRTYMMYQSYLRPNAVETMWKAKRAMPNVLAIAPKEARALKSMSYKVMQDTKEVNNLSNNLDSPENTNNWETVLKKRIEGFQMTNTYVTEEEEEIGRATNFVSFGLGQMIRAPAYSQTRMADMLHGLAKYGCRTCIVTGGDELDDLVVGMPIVVLDHVYSIYGTVESVSFTVMGEGNVQSSISIAMPRMPLHNKFDVITHAGLWFDTPRSAPSNIGKYYGELLGDSAENQSFFNKCKSMADGKFVNGGAMVDKEGLDDDTVLLKMCIASLNNAYINSQNKEEFIKKFRSVTEVTDVDQTGDGQYNEEWLMKKGSALRGGKVKEYLQSLELTKENSQINKYARVTPDSLSYDRMGFISINLKATKWTPEQGKYDAETLPEMAKNGTPFPLSGENPPTGGSFQYSSLNMPVSGTISSGYGMRIHPIKKIKKFHSGVDIAAPEGTAINSVAAGTVVFSGTQKGYGKVIIVDHGEGFTTKYAHCSYINAKKGDIITAGQQIAEVGSTGASTGPHCHYEVNKNGQPVNPMKYFK